MEMSIEEALKVLIKMNLDTIYPGGTYVKGSLPEDEATKYYALGMAISALRAQQEECVVVLPCKVGDEVYTLMGKHEPVKVEGFKIKENGEKCILVRPYKGSHCLNEVPLQYFGKIIFSTIAERDAALKEANT